jgi:metal transporter CNNM
MRPRATESTYLLSLYCCQQELKVVNRIIPQAVSVRYGLSIGARCSSIVLALMYFFGQSFLLHPSHVIDRIHTLAPIAWPIAKLLDKILGKDNVNTYKKAELKSFLQFHRTGEEPLRDDEISILNGVLELNTKKVEKIMTPMTVGPSSSPMLR